MLRSVPLLTGLTRDQLEEIATIGAERTFLLGETIIRQGERGTGLYLILSGTAEVRRFGQTVTVLSAGQFFGEAALLVDQPRTADVLATSDVRGYVLSRWDFWGAIGIDPQANRALFDEIVERLRSFTTELVE